MLTNIMITDIEILFYSNVNMKIPFQLQYWLEYSI